MKEVTAPLISDAAGKRYGLPGIRHITGPTPVVGRALTVKVEGKDWGIVVEAMDEAEEGDVLVIKPEDGIRAFWGGLSSLSAVEKGLAGTVVDGLVRDVEDIEELNYPVFARGTTCQAGSHASKGEIGADVYIGGVLVRTGDVIVADKSGVVVVPEDEWEDVLEAAKEIHGLESKVAADIRDGKPWREILRQI